jgi:hypothetical protein
MNVSLKEAERRLTDLRGLLMDRIARAKKMRAALKLSTDEDDTSCSTSYRNEFDECSYEFRASFHLAQILVAIFCFR